MDVGLPGLEVGAADSALLREAEVDAALGTVIDPELDEPITDLGFVTQRSVTSVVMWSSGCDCPPPSARRTSPT